MKLKMYLNSRWNGNIQGGGALSKQYRPKFSILLRSVQCGFDSSSGHLGLRYVKPRRIS